MDIEIKKYRNGNRNWNCVWPVCPSLNQTKRTLTLKTTGCPRKNALLTLEAPNSGLEASIETCRGSFEIVWFLALIWAQEIHNFVHSSLRKLHLKRAKLTQNLTIFYQDIILYQLMHSYFSSNVSKYLKLINWQNESI